MNIPPIADLYINTVVLIDGGEGLVPASESSLVAENNVVHVITAWNPGDARPTREENDEANQALFDELVQRGASPVRAVGADPDSSHSEESWAVTGLTDDDAREVGAAFGQVAIFRLMRRTQTVVSCFEHWQVSRQL
jgi:hypothetical protein